MEKQTVTCEEFFGHKHLSELWPEGYTLEEATQKMEKEANDKSLSLLDDPEEYIYERIKNRIEASFWQTLIY